MRPRLLSLLLWLSVIGWSTWVGGTLYQMLVIVPLWSAAPPESVRHFFTATEYNRTIFNFFGPPFIAARCLVMVAALVAGWSFPRHRTPLLIVTGCLVVVVLVTLLYVYPINGVLIAQAGGPGSAEEITRMAHRWVAADRARFAVGLVAYGALLYAFRLPIADPSARG